MSACQRCRIRIDEEAGADIAADIVDQDCDRPDPLGSIADADGRHRIQKIGLNEYGRMPTPLQSQRHYARAGLRVSSDHDHPGAFGGKIQRDGAADVGRCTGHDHDLVRYPKIHGSSFSQRSRKLTS